MKHDSNNGMQEVLHLQKFAKGWQEHLLLETASDMEYEDEYSLRLKLTFLLKIFICFCLLLGHVAV